MSAKSLKKSYLLGGRAVEAALRLADGRVTGSLTTAGDEPAVVDGSARRLGAHRLALELDGKRVRATVLRDGGRTWVQIDGRTYEVDVHERGAGGGAHLGEADFAVSPMTGGLTKVSVTPGDSVDKSGELFVVEAMKMEFVVRAPRDLVVASVAYAAGDQVEQGDVVVAFEEEA